MSAPQRLQRVLARAGVASRRKAEALITEGRVTVNGIRATLGMSADPERDRIALDGQPLGAPVCVTYALHKPAGVVTSVGDPHGRPTVMDLVPPQPGLHPVGRLDMETEGLLLLTTDGDLTMALTHPSRGIEKVYLAQVQGDPMDDELEALRQGVLLEDGPTAPARIELVECHGSRSSIRLSIHEGRNRQVRRMCEAVGHPVVRLVRERIGPITLDGLPAGAWRPLTPAEIEALSTHQRR